MKTYLIIVVLNVLLYAIGAQSLTYLSLHYGPDFHPHQVLTYMFIHGTLWHLLFNCLALLSFGSVVEKEWGRYRFAAFYIGTGVFTGLIYCFLPHNLPVAGASAAVYATMVAYASIHPKKEVVMLLFPVSLKAWDFVLLCMVVEVIAAIINYQMDAVAHMAHIIGISAALLYLYIVWVRRK